MPDTMRRALISTDRGPQQTLTTEIPWLNVIITPSKCISIQFICVISIIIPVNSQSFAPLYRDDIVVTAVDINACDTCQ